MQGVLLAARLGLAAVFLTAGISKLIDRSGAREAVAGFGLPAPFAPAVATLLPLVELALGAALLPVASARPAAIGAAALLIAFSLAIAVNLSAGRAPDCHCFGQLTRGRLSWWSVARNVTLAAAGALVAAAQHPGESVGAGLGGLSASERFGVLAIIVVVPLVVLEWRVLLGAFAGNGRSLLALERLEMAASVGSGLIPAGLHTSLPVGSPAPHFSLAAATGGVVTDEDLATRGRTVLLVFTDVRCQPCMLLLPEVARWQAAYGEQVSVAVIGRGSVADHRALAAEHRVDDILVQEAREVAEAYRASVTPAAVLLRSDGTIGSGVAPGDERIRLLLAAALREGGGVRGAVSA